VIIYIRYVISWWVKDEDEVVPVLFFLLSTTSWRCIGGV